jgi:hypothetical protein
MKTEQPIDAYTSACSGSDATARCVDLQRFCWANDYRKHLRQPWAHKGWMYASNGQILVRVPAPEHAETVFAEKVAESAVGMLADIGGREYAPLPAFTLGAVCEYCKGVGTIKQSKCPDCDGDGQFDHGDHSYDCKACDGEGWINDTAGEDRECYACDGFGTHSKSINFGGGIGYQARYLHLIEDLPGLLFSPGTCVDQTTTKPAHFTFDGGEGLLMPMREQP